VNAGWRPTGQASGRRFCLAFTQYAAASLCAVVKGPEHCVAVLHGALGTAQPSTPAAVSNASPASGIMWFFRGEAQGKGEGKGDNLGKPWVQPASSPPTRPTPDAPGASGVLNYDDERSSDAGSAGAALIFSSRPSSIFKGRHAVHVSRPNAHFKGRHTVHVKTALRSHQSLVFVVWSWAEVTATARGPRTATVDAARGAPTAVVAAAAMAKEAAPAAAAAHRARRRWAKVPAAARA
jgi:hypothetical protein